MPSHTAIPKEIDVYGLRWVEGGWWSIAAWTIFSRIVDSRAIPDDWRGSLVSGLCAIVAILAAVGVRRRRKFGRIATLVLSYFLVLIEALFLLLWVEGEDEGLALLLAIPSVISVWPIWYLTRPHVKEAFGVGKKPASLPPENPVTRAEKGDTGSR